MHAVVLAVLSSGLAAADVPLPEEAVVVDHTEVAGDWEVVSCVAYGQDFSVGQSCLEALSFRNDWCVWSFHDKPFNEGGFDLTPSGNPAGIIIHFNLDSFRCRGIYQVRGSWMDLAWSRFGPSPTQFASEKGSNVVLLKLHRVKK